MVICAHAHPTMMSYILPSWAEWDWTGRVTHLAFVVVVASLLATRYLSCPIQLAIKSTRCLVNKPALCAYTPPRCPVLLSFFLLCAWWPHTDPGTGTRYEHRAPSSVFIHYKATLIILSCLICIYFSIITENGRNLGNGFTCGSYHILKFFYSKLTWIVYETCLKSQRKIRTLCTILILYYSSPLIQMKFTLHSEYYRLYYIKL